jgi:hypothetical protein
MKVRAKLNEKRYAKKIGQKFRALKVKMWPLWRNENRQDNDSQTRILKYGDAAPKQYWRFAPNRQWLQIFFNCSST